ncbi:MAG: hypothetical protein R3D05_15275 [Dongiaceae bacterium]
MRPWHLILSIIALSHGYADSSQATSGGQEGDIEMVANCVYRDVDTTLQSSSSIQKSIMWNKKRTAADIVVRSSGEVVATYHVMQLLDSVQISSEIAHASPDVKTAAARESRMTNACLDEGGY